MIAKIAVIFATLVVASQAATLLAPGIVPGVGLYSPLGIPSTLTSSSIVSIPGAVTTQSRTIGSPLIYGGGLIGAPLILK